MKKKTMMIWLFVCIMGLAGCAEEEPVQEQEPQVEVEEEVEEEEIKEDVAIVSIVEELNAEGYEFPLDAEYFENTLAELLGAEEGYRYFDEETLETTELYRFVLKEDEEVDLSDIEVVEGEEIVPNLAMDDIIIFSEDIELLEIVYTFVTEEEFDPEIVFMRELENEDESDEKSSEQGESDSADNNKKYSTSTGNERESAEKRDNKTDSSTNSDSEKKTDNNTNSDSEKKTDSKKSSDSNASKEIIDTTPAPEPAPAPDSDSGSDTGGTEDTDIVVPG